MKRLVIGSLVLLLAASMAVPSVAAAEPFKRRTISAREGDNTVYLRWNASKRKIVEASSSRRISSGQEVELLTSVSDRTGKLEVKAILRNISDGTIYRVDGRLVHRVFEGGKEIRILRSPPIHGSLRPGEKVVARFSYMLKTGEYSARTDLITE